MTLNLPWLVPLQTQLSEQLMLGRLHHALLIEAASGHGKRQFVQALAAGLLCEQSGVNSSGKLSVKACGHCKACHLFKSGAHPDFFVANDPDAKSIGVDLIRQLVNKSQTKSQLSGAKVFIIPDCHKMTEAAANALLKTLEEPGENTYLLLTTEQKTRLLPTILSRCQQYFIESPSYQSLQSWLDEQGVNKVDFETIFKQVHQAPLTALDLVKSDYLIKQKAFLANFKRLITQQVTASQFIASINGGVNDKFNDQDANLYLDWLNYAIAQWLKAKFERKSETPDAATKRLVLTELDLLINKSRQQMLQSGMNKKLIFQRLMIHISQKLAL